jgi:uncharacterized protein (DUF1800 family)
MKSRTQRQTTGASRAGCRGGTLHISVLAGILLVLGSVQAFGAATSFFTVPPCRVLDTRAALGTFGGPALAGGNSRSYFLAPTASLAGQCGISPTAVAISANVTVTQPTAAGFVKIYPAGTAAPTTSVISFRAGQTRANNAILGLGTSGGIVAVAGVGAGNTTHFIIDIVGYFDNGANNQPPSVNAGGDKTITLPALASLSGTASDDGKPSPPGALTYVWSKILGPGNVTFGNPNVLATNASFTEAGTYTLRLTVSDSQIANHDDVNIFVNPPQASNPPADMTRFLEQATWGPTGTDLAHLQSIGMVAWLNEQFNMAASSYPSMALWPNNQPSTCTGTCGRDNYSMYLLQRRFFTNAMYGPDQLRQRVAFALHQLIVVSGTTITQPSWMTPYLQTIDRNAFGNFRQLLYEMTLTPAMGVWLDMATNTAGNPNENYAREIMQLFSVGLYNLNLDGSVILDGSGNPEESYDQDQVTGLAHVLTGWRLAPNLTSGGSGFCTPQNSCPDYITPMPFVVGSHDTGTKTIIDNIVVPAGQTGDQDLNQAIDALYYHPNVGPYLATNLIHSLVTSNPTPGYVQRVAQAFNDNGIGVRGDMQAVITAILLDPEARGDVKSAPEYGHLKQPVLFLTNILRAFNAKSANLSGPSDGYLDPQVQPMNQDVFRPTTVFSYYPADFEVPGMSLTGPEFGIFTATEALKRANFTNTIVFSTIPVSANAPSGTAIDLSGWLPLASNPNALITQMNMLMMHGTMSSAMQTSIATAVNAVAASNPLLRVQQALYLIATSSQFQVER